MKSSCLTFPALGSAAGHDGGIGGRPEAARQLLESGGHHAQQLPGGRHRSGRLGRLCRLEPGVVPACIARASPVWPLPLQVQHTLATFQDNYQ